MGIKVNSKPPRLSRVFKVLAPKTVLIARSLATVRSMRPRIMTFAALLVCNNEFVSETPGSAPILIATSKKRGVSLATWTKAVARKLAVSVPVRQ